MTPPRLNIDQQKGLGRASTHAELAVHEQWLRYFTLGGNVDPTEVDPSLNTLMLFTSPPHSILALTVNERLRELRPPHAPYL